MTLLAVILLLAANGFFVAAEFALVKAKGFRLEALAEEGSQAAELTVRILARLEAYLAACQLGITMASLGLGWVGEPAVAALLEPPLASLGLAATTQHLVAFLVGFVVFSSLHIVVGEQVPKTLAIRQPEPISLLVAWPLRAFYVATWPLTRLLELATSGILRLFGAAPATHADIPTREDLRQLIEVSTECGMLQERRALMLHELIQFDQRPVAQVMIPRVRARVLNLETPPEENLRVMRESRHSRFPLLRNRAGELAGVLLARDVFEAFLDGESTPWHELERFCREPIVVSEGQKAARLFERMRQGREHVALVVDECGDFAGLVTLEDLIEESVGDIADETDERLAREGILWRDDHWEASSLASISDVCRATDAELEHGFAVNTLSGLLMDRLQRMPVKGDEIEVGGLRIEVLSVEGRRVSRVRLQNVAPTGAAAEGGGAGSAPDPSGSNQSGKE